MGEGVQNIRISYLEAPPPIKTTETMRANVNNSNKPGWATPCIVTVVCTQASDVADDPMSVSVRTLAPIPVD